jgi:hypothetical protein
MYAQPRADEGALRVMAGSHVEDIISKGKSAVLGRFYAEFQSKFRIIIQRGPHILSLTRQSSRAITAVQPDGPQTDSDIVLCDRRTSLIAPTMSSYFEANPTGCVLPAVYTVMPLRTHMHRDTGTVALWSGYISARSSKITMVTLSASEAERTEQRAGPTPSS